MSAHTGIRYKQPKPLIITGPHLTTVISAIKYATTLKNKFDILQELSETLIPNDEYENIVHALTEAAVEGIATKLRAKHRVLWETLAMRKKNKIT